MRLTKNSYASVGRREGLRLRGDSPKWEFAGWTAFLWGFIVSSALFVYSFVEAAQLDSTGVSLKPSAALDLTRIPAVCTAAVSPDTGLRVGKGQALVKEDALLNYVAVEHEAFYVRSSRFVAEYQLHVAEYVHRETGLTVISITSPSSEREMVFSACFRTPVSDSKGTPHVLEHSVLAGSKKYPVKSPFSYLMKASLNTFLNAMTWPDRTCYPVASVNSKDFYNLASVYMDAVFAPKVVDDPLILKQEGWRYELYPRTSASEKDVSDGAAPIDCIASRDLCELKYTGVVYSEMQGVLSNPLDREWLTRSRALFPQISSYSCNSGGDPAEIPNLTLDDLRSFYYSLYHPENARVYFYGSDDVRARLNFINDYMKDYIVKGTPTDTRIFGQPGFDAPRYVEELYAVSEGDVSDWVTVSWVLNPCDVSGAVCEDISQDERLALQILKELLAGGRASPLTKALVDSGLGSSPLDAELEFGMKHAVFSVGLRGVESRDGAAKEVEDLIISTFGKLGQDGFADDAIAAAVNTVEFRMRECLPTRKLPKGLHLILEMASEANFDRDQLAPLMFEEPLERLKIRLSENESIFQELIYRYFINNTHRVTVRLRGDAMKAQNDAEEKRQRLEEIKNALSDEQLRAIVFEQEELKQKQMTADPAEALATLPTLDRADLAEEGEEIPLVVSEIAAIPLLLHILPTSGVLYFDTALPLSRIAYEELPLVVLLARMLTEGGAGSLSREQLQHRIGEATGGIRAYVEVQTIPEKPLRIPSSRSARAFLIISGKASFSRVRDMLCLMYLLLSSPDLSDGLRGIQTIKELIAEREHNLLEIGHRMSRWHASAALSSAAAATDATLGIKSLQFLHMLLPEAQSNWKDVEMRLRSILHRLLQGGGVILNATADSDGITALQKEPARGILESLAMDVFGSAEDSTNSFRHRSHSKRSEVPRVDLWANATNAEHTVHLREALVIPAQVSFPSLAVQFSAEGKRFLGSDVVAVEHLSLVYMWDDVRERGGAYGAWSMYDTNGLLVFASYRDPNPRRTLSSIRAAVPHSLSWAENASENDILQAAIPVIANLDKPLTNESKGLASFWQYVKNETAEHRMAFRKQVLNASIDEMQDFAKRLKQAMQHADRSIFILGSQQQVRDACEAEGGSCNTLSLKVSEK